MKTYFGIPFDKSTIAIGKETFDSRDYAARIFICPRISVEHVLQINKMISSGSISAKSLIAKTDAGIAELRTWKQEGKDFSSIMKKKLASWVEAFEEPNTGDFDYLETAYGITRGDIYGEKSMTMEKINSAKDMADYVKQYVKGQDEAIEKLSVPFFLHLDSKRKNYTSRIKTPSLLMGPTGIGKSEILRIFGKVCDCPVIRINSTDIVPMSWKGPHLPDIIAKELSDGKVTLEDLKYAVIVIHEFDKITHFGRTYVGTAGGDEDMDMMRDIMRLFETDHCLNLNTGFDNASMKEKIVGLPVDNLLIVFDGAFHGIESIIKRRLKIGNSIGFNSTENNPYEGMSLQKFVTNDDLEEWGYMPELLGRIGETIVMNPLTSDTIYQIMTTAKDNVLQAHIETCSQNNIDLHFTEDALHYIAGVAEKSGLGFRNVKTILSKALNRLYYEMPAKASQQRRRVEIDKAYITKNM